MRDPADWTDRKYVHDGLLAHLVPYGTERSMCGLVTPEHVAYGTGDFDEIEHAENLPTCLFCLDAVTPTTDPAVNVWEQAMAEMGEVA